MGLQSNGSISLSDIAGEFGGSTPHSLSEYYGKGGVTASGAISLGDFYGKSSAPPPGYLGCQWGGGYLISCHGGYWIVAPESAEVKRTWYDRGDAITRAELVSGCTDWFVPNGPRAGRSGVLHDPGFLCRNYWDSYKHEFYWSDTSNTPTSDSAVAVYFGYYGHTVRKKTSCYRVRAFRFVRF